MDKTERALFQELKLIAANLVNDEEHLYETARKTKDPKIREELFKIAHGTRLLRTNVMRRMLFGKSDVELSDVKKRTHLGEIWCSVKHKLSVSIHYIESIEKLVAEGKFDEANELLEEWESHEMLLDALMGVVRGEIHGDEGRDSKDA